MHFAPAELTDYAALFPARPLRCWRAAAVQMLAGSAWTLWHDGRPLAIAGLYPLHSGIFEGWLMLAPRDALGPAALRHLLDRASTVLPDVPVIVRVDDGNRAGRRLATLAGFVPLDEVFAGQRTWLRRWT